MRKPVLVSIAFLGLAGIHVGIPVSTLAERAAILAHGTEVRLALTTQDPRSLFRGEYSSLTYAIGILRDLPVPDDERDRCAPAAVGGRSGPVPADCSVRPGSELFVVLEPVDDGTHRAVAASLTRPASTNLFIRGKVRYGSHQNRVGQRCASGRCFSGQVSYGIETWFGPQGVPAQVDAAARADIKAVVRVDASGQAVLADLLLAGRPVGVR